MEHAVGHGGEVDRGRRGVGRQLQPDLGPHRDTRVLDGALTQERSEDAEVVLHVHRRFVERQPEHVVDDDLVRQPDTQRQPAAEGGVYGQGLRRQHHRMAWVGGHDRRTDLDALGAATGHGQGSQRVPAEDLWHPHRVEAKPLEVLEALSDVVERLIDEERCPYAHGEPPDRRTATVAATQLLNRPFDACSTLRDGTGPTLRSDSQNNVRRARVARYRSGGRGWRGSRTGADTGRLETGVDRSVRPLLSGRAGVAGCDVLSTRLVMGWLMRDPVEGVDRAGLIVTGVGSIGFRHRLAR